MGSENVSFDLTVRLSASNSPQDDTDRRLAAELVGRIAAVAAEPRYRDILVSAPHPDSVPAPVGWGPDEDAPAEPEDTMPQWLAARFGTGTWTTMDDDTRSWWAHEAAAVRRAVARGGFKETK